jgi:hypothetical protein
MKLLLENWNKYLLSEGISSAIDKFRRCYDDHRKMLIKREEDLVERRYGGVESFSDRPFTAEEWVRDRVDKALNAQKLEDETECLRGFRPLGRGSFRSVYLVPDNPNIVLKVVREHGGTMFESAVGSNREEAEFGRDPKFVEFVPKVYDVSDDYHWITAQKVEVVHEAGDEVMIETFPEFAEEGRVPPRSTWVTTVAKGRPPGRGAEGTLIDFDDAPSEPEYTVPKTFNWNLWKDILVELVDGVKTGEVSYSPLKGRESGEAEYELPKALSKRYVISTGDRAAGLRLGAPMTPELSKSLKDPNNIIHRLVNFILEKDLTVWDFKPANLGYVEEEGRKRFVVLDPVARGI